jgi:hypothetical protein
VGVVNAGPLDPPASVSTTTTTGPTQIYQPSGCAGFPIVLSTGGSYILAQNIVMPAACAKNGIEITVDGVDLDLGGFRVHGAGSPSLDGIKNLGGCGNCEIKNGIVRSWGGVGINMAGSNNAQISEVRVSSNRGAGIVLGSMTSVRDCSVVSNGQGAPSDGIDASVALNPVIDACESNGNTRHGISLGTGGVIRDCVASENSSNGIEIVGMDTVVRDCLTRSNGSYGIFSAGSRARISRNHAIDNHVTLGCAEIWITGAGISSIVEDNSAENAAGGCGLIWFDAGAIHAYRNVVRGGGGYVVTGACVACDIGPIGTAAGSGSPWANIFMP